MASIESLKVARENLGIREKSLEQARARVAVGASAQIEVIQAEAEVASNLEQVIVAEASISQAEDNLRTLILDPARPDYWQVRLEPTDTITLTPRQIDVDAAIKNALANRLDLTIATAERRDHRPEHPRQPEQRAAGGRFQPQLPRRRHGRRGPVGRRAPSSAASAACSGKRSAATFRPGRSACKWRIRSAAPPHRRRWRRARFRSGSRSSRSATGELEVVRQVRDAARQVQNSLQRVQATQAALSATQQQLTAEERRFAVGLSTTLDMQIRQTQLAQARVNELNARISYNRALINFERVQKDAVALKCAGVRGSGVPEVPKVPGFRRVPTHPGTSEPGTRGTPHPEPRHPGTPVDIVPPGADVPKLTVTVITRNEAANIEACLRVGGLG